MESTNHNNEIKRKNTTGKKSLPSFIQTIVNILIKFYECIIPSEIRTNNNALRKLIRIFVVVCVFLVVQATLITVVIFKTVKTSGDPVRLPNVVGLDMYEGMELLQNEGFNINVEVQYFSDRPTKTVMVQKPDANTILRKGRTINLIINDAVTIGDMPSVIGLSYEEALEKISSSQTTSKKVNLPILTPLRVSDSKQEPNVIIAQSPLENEKLSSGSSIQLTINSYVPRGGGGGGGGGSSGNAQFTYSVPLSVGDDSTLTISLDDDSGTKTIFERKVKPAERISFRYNLSGSGTITILYDGVPYDNRQVQE